MKNIRSLFDRCNDDSEPGDDADSNGVTNSFAGGSKSGIAIQNPHDKEASNGSPGRTWGKAKISDSPPPPGAQKITLYKNGFKTEDAEFRSFDFLENQTFLQDIRNGVAPGELTKGSTGPVSLIIDDKSNEVYEPPPAPKYTLFSGSGQSLGAKRHNDTPSRTDSTVDIAKAAEILKLDPSQRTTVLRIRLHTGTTITQQFNVSNTLEQLHNFIAGCTPGCGPYRLLAGFPPKPILDDDLSSSISSSGLLNETITQVLTVD